MEQNKFYLLRSSNKVKLSTWTHSVVTGQSQQQVGNYGYPLTFEVVNIKEGSGYKPIFIVPDIIKSWNYQVLMYNASNIYIGYVDSMPSADFLELREDTKYIEVNFLSIQKSEADITNIWFYIGYRVVPHYKKIEIKSKKQSNQMFFRESIDGQIKLFGDDYRYVKESNLEQNLAFVIVHNSSIISKNIFNKTDCKFDYVKYSVELKMSPEDKYTQILDKYDNTYDLIKLAPAITPLILTKRMAYQFYIAGANNVTTVEGSGIYYEDDVNKIVNNDEELRTKYHFYGIDTRREIHLAGFNYESLNGTYIVNASSDAWINQTGTDPGAFIKFDKVYSIGESYSGTIRRISNGRALDAAELDDEVYEDGHLKVDLYRINIYTGLPDGSTGTPTKIYSTSGECFFKDQGNFKINGADDRGYYKLWAVEQLIPSKSPTPSNFMLDESIIDYGIYCRIICNKKNVSYSGTSYELYNIPSDDFCFDRANYKYCIGANPGVTISQILATSTTPTRYGRDDYNNYFSINYFGNTFAIKPIPVSRSSWANTSIWAEFGYDFHDVVSAFSQEYTLKDAYDLADVISVLLKQIDPNIKHEHTADYSQFLYATNSPLLYDESRYNCSIYIAPKSNVLKSNYDQAAQKAEITFEKLMNMLRDCFRCYWFIDNQNRLRIEHVSYFLNGGSYNSPNRQWDLTTRVDKFNKKAALYCQQEIEFDKSDLSSRYEFEWMDDCTDEFGNNSIDVNSQYIQKDKTENINAGIFSSDIDLMLCAPDKFSSDGFVLLIANNNSKKVPIADIGNFYDGDCIYGAKPQNYLASWLYLMRYYMLDMSASQISYTNIMYNTAYTPRGIKKSKKHDIQFPSSQMSVYVNAGLIKTDVGEGYIEEKTINIDTNLVKLELRYAPD